MSKKEFFVNVNMTIKLNSISSMKYIREAIENGMEFEDSEGIIYYDMEVEESNNVPNLMYPSWHHLNASREDGCDEG